MNPYDILGINSDASEDEIKKAYRTLAKKSHPDKGGSVEKFREINDAYTKIMKGDDPLLEFPDLAEIFKMFGAFSGMNFSNNFIHNFIRGPTIKTSLSLTLEQLENGGLYSVKYRRKVPTGKMNTMIIKTPDGVMQALSPEEIEKEYEVNVEIPSCYDKKILVLQGLAKADNTPPGDLEISIIIFKHPLFTKFQMDLHLDLNITLKESLVGFKREINMLNSNDFIKLECESIVNPYEPKRIEGHGMNNKISGIKGDLIIKFKILFPVILSENTKNIIRDLIEL